MDEERQFTVRALSDAQGLGHFFPAGGALLRDALRYAVARWALGGSATRAVAEAMEVLVFPQLQDLGDQGARAADQRLSTLFAGDSDALEEVRTNFRLLFPHLSFQ